MRANERSERLSGPFKTRFLHYYSCPTVRDWIAVYLALFFNMTQLIYFALFWFKVGPLRVLKGGPMGVCSQKYILQMLAQHYLPYYVLAIMGLN